jgi:hypothetical protein
MDSVDSIVAWLVANEYEQIGYSYDERRFGDTIVEMKRSGVVFRVVRDRGLIGVDCKLENAQNYTDIYFILGRIGVDQSLLGSDANSVLLVLSTYHDRIIHAL